MSNNQQKEISTYEDGHKDDNGNIIYRIISRNDNSIVYLVDTPDSYKIGHMCEKENIIENLQEKMIPLQTLASRINSASFDKSEDEFLKATLASCFFNSITDDSKPINDYFVTSKKNNINKDYGVKREKTY